MANRALPSIVKLRPDIEWVHYPDQQKWVAKDPISNLFFYFSEFDYAIARRLDGTRTLSELLATPYNQLGGHLTRRWLNRFVRSLASSRLLQTNSLSANRSIQANAGRFATWFLQAVLSPLAVRIPLLRPQQHPSLIQWMAWFLFDPYVVAVVMIATLFNAWFMLNQVLGNPERLIYEVSRIQGDRWLLILLVYLVVKVLHELGHWAACAKWRADCREIGILLLCFTPCLYCDISDCWKLPSKWRRAAIAFAGIYVELLLANLAAVVWMNSTGELSRLLAGSVILACTLGTVLVNGNPCFKYDGYYILSDLWGVPNLHQQSSVALWQAFVYLLGGRRPNGSDFDANVWWLSAFCIISAIYRVAVLFLLVWVLWMVLEPRGLGLVALYIFVPILVSKFMGLVRFIRSIILEAYSRRGLSMYRLGGLIIVLLAGVSASIWVPISTSVRARGVLNFVHQKPLFVSRTASVNQSELLRQTVEAGDVVIELDSPELELELLQLSHEINLLKTKIELLRQAAVDDPLAGYEIPTSSELVKEYEARHKLLEPEKSALRQVAHQRGRLIPSNLKAPSPISMPVDIRRQASVLAASNLGCTVERGATLGWLVTDERISIDALVSQQDIKSLRVGMACDCLLDSEVFNKLPGRIARISIEPVDELPVELVGDPMLAVTRDETGRLQPELPHYQVSVELLQPLERPLPGSLASVRFSAPNETLWSITRKFLFNEF